MPTISLDEARDLLEPYHLALVECFYKAWSIYRTSISPLLPTPLVRDVRSIMSSLVDQQFRSSLAAEDGVAIRVINERVLAYMQDRLILHNKAFINGKLQTRNNPTPSSQAFENGEQIEGFPELDFPRACVGYRLNSLHTEILGVYVRSNQMSDRWSYEIGRSAPRAVVFSFPGPKKVADGAKRFRPKKSEGDKKKSADGEDTD